MSEFKGSKRVGKLVNEVEGILTDVQVIHREYANGDPYVSLIVTVDNGARMMVPGNIDSGGKFPYPFDFDLGLPFAGRSFIVPAVNSETGVLYDAKHYSFPDSEEGPVALSNCLTEKEYLASNYPGKPKSTKR